MDTLGYNPIQRDIQMIKGDTLSFAFQIQGLGGEPPTSIFFTCKETPESSEELFMLEPNDGIELRDYDSDNDVYTFALRVPPEYTQDLETGRYFYDLQMTCGDDVLTLMIGRFIIDYEITTYI